MFDKRTIFPNPSIAVNFLSNKFDNGQCYGTVSQAYIGFSYGASKQVYSTDLYELTPYPRNHLIYD